jgi:integrase/recombinase XerD
MNWESSIENFKNFLRLERGLSQNSINSYEYDLNLFKSYLKSNSINISPLECDSETIKRYLYSELSTKKTRSMARGISALKSYYNYLVFENLIKMSPLSDIDTPKLEKKLPEVLTENEILKIINSIDDNHPFSIRNRAIIEVLYGTGIRVSELIDIKLSNLFFEEKILKVKGKGDKERFVPIGNVASNSIKIYLEERINNKIEPKYSDVLFLNRYGRQLTRAMIFKIIKDLCEISGIEKKISPHTLRHSFATHMLKNGADLRSIQLILGHENINTTEIYTHLDKFHLEEVLKKYHPRSKN